VDARAEHLIGLVEDGATLEEAARVYGITRERVRQILKEEGVSARELPGRRQKIRDRRLALYRELAPAIEAMWREGMLAHEIAKVLGISRDGVQRLIGERVPRSERIARTTQRLNDGRSPEERVLHGLRAGASVLGQSDEIKGYEASRAHGLIEGWLAASETPASDRAPEVQAPPRPAGLTAEDLKRELDRFKHELRAAGLRQSTIHSYACGASIFVRWLAADYVPTPGRADRLPRRRPGHAASRTAPPGLCPECRV
jgi:transposase